MQTAKERIAAFISERLFGLVLVPRGLVYSICVWSPKQLFNCCSALGVLALEGDNTPAIGFGRVRLGEA